MAETELNEKIKVEGVDEAVSKLGKLWKATERIAKAFEGLSEIAGAVGGIAGMWAIGETVRDVDHLYQAVGRVKAMTGIAAGQAHALFDMFELSGVEMEGAERIMISLARLSGKLGDGVTESAEQAQKLNQIMARIGVTAKSGPTERILDMAKAAKAGKLQINDLISAFSIPRSQAARMMAMLQQGPDRLREIQKETLGGADLIDDATLQSYQRMVQVRRELKDAWGDLVGVFYKNLIPAVTLILQGIQKEFKKIEPIVAKIGSDLAAHMTTVVRLAKTFGMLMLANRGINMFAGEGNAMGVTKRLKSWYGIANGAMAARAAKAGGADYFSARDAAPGIGMFASAGGGITKIFSSVAGRLGIIGAVVAIVIVAFKMLADNVWGIRDRLSKTFGSIWGDLKTIVGQLLGILGGLWHALEPVVGILAGVLLFALDAFATMLEGVLRGIIGIINGVIWLLNKLPAVDIDKIDLDKLKKDKADKTPDSAESSQVYQDFRGSKFEIANNFPQNVDGARVAVSFGDQLAKLGERRIDAGVRPLYSYR